MPETYTVTQVFPEGVGRERRVTGLVMTGPEVMATLDDPSTCEDLIHEADHCGMRAAECWDLRPWTPQWRREEADREREREASMPGAWRHPEGLVWFRL